MNTLRKSVSRLTIAFTVFLIIFLSYAINNEVEKRKPGRLWFDLLEEKLKNSRLCVLDSNGFVRYWTENAANLFEVEDKDILGKSVKTLIDDPELWQRHKAAIEKSASELKQKQSVIHCTINKNKSPTGLVIVVTTVVNQKDLYFVCEIYLTEEYAVKTVRLPAI